AQLVVRGLLAHPVDAVLRVALVDHQHVGVAPEIRAAGEPIIVDMEDDDRLPGLLLERPHVCQPFESPSASPAPRSPTNGRAGRLVPAPDPVRPQNSKTKRQRNRGATGMFAAPGPGFLRVALKGD